MPRKSPNFEFEPTQAHLCVLAENCDEAAYKKLVQALCQEHGIPLVKVDNNHKLGEWAGLCKLDSEGNARKVVRCSAVAIRDRSEHDQSIVQLNRLAALIDLRKKPKSEFAMISNLTELTSRS